MTAGSGIALAALVGSGVWGWRDPQSPWLICALGALIAALSHRGDFGIDVMVYVWGWRQWLKGRRNAARQRILVAEMENFLRRMKQLLEIGRGASYALETATAESCTDAWPYGREGPDPWMMLLERWPVRPMRELARVWRRVDRHGGDLAAIVGGVLGAHQRRRREQQAVALESESKRSSVVVLVFALPVVFAVLRVILPQYFHVLMTTRSGAVVLAWIAICEAGSFWLLGKTVPGQLQS